MHVVSIWDFALMTVGPLIILISAVVQSEFRAARIGKAARNERRKISATYLNGLALAFFIGGAVSLFFSADLFTPIQMSYEVLNRGVAIFFGLCMSAFFHFSARLLLNRIED